MTRSWLTHLEQLGEARREQPAGPDAAEVWAQR